MTVSGGAATRRFLAGALLLVAIIGSTMSDSGLPQAPEFFKVEDNLTQIRWAHAVNSWENLNSTLANETIHMIEADVSMVNGTPTMAHSDKEGGNFTLEQFMETINATKDLKKGIKLDFKNTEVLAPSMDIVKKYLTTLQVPLWLNADIVTSTSPSSIKEVDANKFFEIMSPIKGAVISAGWTTGGCIGNYSVGDVEKMKNIIPNNVTITYAVRACLAADTSPEIFTKVLDQSEKSTLTVWSSIGDVLSPQNLSTFINTVGVKRVYLDVPDEVRAKLDIGNGAGQLLVQSPLMVLTVLLSAFYAFKMF